MQRTFIPLGIIAFSLSLCASMVMAGTKSNSVIPACAYQDIDIQKYGYAPFQNPPEIRSKDGVLDTSFTVQYTDPATTSIAGCPVTLRTYNGQLVGPTLRVRQGDVINLLLNNQLPKETANEVQAQFEQENKNAYLATIPASFNTTNMHYHGLHVSPTGNSDNVLLDIAPQSQ